jgi:hypothetical protein
MVTLSRKFFTVLTLFSFLSALLPSAAFAAGPLQTNALKGGPYTLTDDMMETRAAEFVMRRFPGEHLIPVRILSGVKNPGIYYVPEGTDLITALALSGGLLATADPDKVHVNQWATQKSTTFEMSDVMAEPGKMNPKLASNDVVMIEDQKPWISNNTVLLVTVLTGVLSIALSARALTK